MPRETASGQEKKSAKSHASEELGMCACVCMGGTMGLKIVSARNLTLK